MTEFDLFDTATVCRTHGRFVPCRAAGYHEHTTDPYWVAMTRRHQRGLLATWPPDDSTTKETSMTTKDERAWVPLPDGPTEAHVGKRLRVVWNNGDSVVQDEWSKDYRGNLGFVGGYGEQLEGHWVKHSGDWFIHPDDVPDPDAEILKVLEDALFERGEKSEGILWGSLDLSLDTYRALARAALASLKERGVL